MKSNAPCFAVALAFAAGPTLAHAHAQVGEATGFLTGFLHPLTGLDHIIAMVAVGLWGAQLGAPANLDAAGDVPDGDGIRRLSRPHRRPRPGR